MPQLAKEIFFEDLVSNFHRPLITVAMQFGVSQSYLKKVCRNHGILKWPYRKVCSAAHSCGQQVLTSWSF